MFLPSIFWAAQLQPRSEEQALLCEIRSAAPYAGLKDQTFEEILNFIATGGYSLKAYDRFRRLVRDPDGSWRIAGPRVAQQNIASMPE